MPKSINAYVWKKFFVIFLDVVRLIVYRRHMESEDNKMTKEQEILKALRYAIRDGDACEYLRLSHKLLDCLKTDHGFITDMQAIANASECENDKL